ncbi:MAG: glycoside hydrolase family 3 C-terminal domain-containing protein, partial [Candidatus Onthovivens sp.]
IKAGNDLEMPGDTLICRKWLKDAINDGSLDVKDLDMMVRNILALVQKHENKEKLESISWEEHHELAKEIALEGAVLLKNENMLPLNKEEELLIVGELFEKMRFQGAGSSMINPYLYISPKNAFENNGIKYKYFKGYKESELESNPNLLNEALNAAKDYKKVVVFAGLTDYAESEGGDRDTMSLPVNQLNLINELVKQEKEIILVLFGGSVISLPFYDNVKAILNMFLPGQNGGQATYELLYGVANPSGKLSETWPITYKDVPFGKSFGKGVNEIYKESIYVGYRYYLSANKEVRFPFGYGLSYSKFVYSDLNIKKENNKLSISLNVKNDSDVDGDEIVQAYVSSPKEKAFKALRELKGFIKVHLKASETKTVNIDIDLEELKFWAIKENRFVLETGEYKIQIGKNSRDIILEKSIEIEGEEIDSEFEKTLQNPYENLKFDEISDELFEKMTGVKVPLPLPKKPITLESRFTDYKSTFMGKILYNSVLASAKKEMKEALKLPEGTERENKIKGATFLKRILDSNSIRTLSMSAGQNLRYNFAEGFKDLANGHIIRGIKDFTTKIKAPLLPDDKEVK